MSRCLFLSDRFGYLVMCMKLVQKGLPNLPLKESQKKSLSLRKQFFIKKQYSISNYLCGTYRELSQKNRFQSLRIAALCLYNIQRKTWLLKNLPV